jgi:hypothetical protein
MVQYLKDLVVSVGPAQHIQEIVQDNTAHLGPENWGKKTNIMKDIFCYLLQPNCEKKT